MAGFYPFALGALNAVDCPGAEDRRQMTKDRLKEGNHLVRPYVIRPLSPVLCHPMPEPAIEVERLVKVYGTTRAVDGISFALAPGSITGLLGGNGAGKTTTIAMILGLVMPTSGRVQVLGHPMPEQSAEVLGRMNFESPYVDMPMRLTVRQNLTIFGRLYAGQTLAARLEQLASDLDPKDFLDRANGNLSAGQKTRAALAQALL